MGGRPHLEEEGGDKDASIAFFDPRVRVTCCQIFRRDEECIDLSAVERRRGWR